MNGLVLNPNEQVVKYIRDQVKSNNGYCIMCSEHNKSTKCNKYCKKSGNCLCGMYISQDFEPDEYDLD